MSNTTDIKNEKETVENNCPNYTFSDLERQGFLFICLVILPCDMLYYSHYLRSEDRS